MNLETKVGIFVILGFFMVALTTTVFGNLDLNSKEGKTVYFRLNDATGIREGTPIMYKGIKVGEVQDVTMKNNEIISKVIVYHEFEIPDNVRFNVKQSGFVGQRYVEFEADPTIQSKSPLQNNYEYDGRQNSANMDAVMAKLNDVAAEMTTLLKSFNEVITTDESKNALQDSISNLKDITESVKNIVATNDKNIQEVIDNAKNMTDMIERIIAKNENQLNSSISNIAEISETLKAFTASVDKLVANNQGNIDDSLKNLKEITDKVNTTMDEIETITKDINEGKGTLGLLINDEETKKKNFIFYEDKTLHDSSLSKSTHAILANDFGLEEMSYDLYERALNIDLGPQMKSSDEGIHSASIGGIWESTVMGFGGVRMEGENLRIAPRLPKKWSKLVFPLSFQGVPLKITVDHSEVAVENHGDKDIELLIGSEKTCIKAGHKESKSL